MCEHIPTNTDSLNELLLHYWHVHSCSNCLSHALECTPSLIQHQ